MEVSSFREIAETAFFSLVLEVGTGAGYCLTSPTT